MPHYVNNPDYEHGSAPVTGVLLTNLGTPDAPDTPSLRRYLAEFLSDPRVVEMNPWLWKLILHGIILRTRPRRSAEAYRKIWTAEGSPLLAIAQRQANAIQQALEEKLAGPVRVALGMRYGNPSIGSALRELQRANAQRILVLPLYPQYSASTSGSTFDAVAAELRRWRWVPDLRMVMDYHLDSGWLEAMAQSIRDDWQANGRGRKLLMSFHGLPKRYHLNGDPYYCQCHASAREIAARLELAEDQWQLVFQSRFGREEWLQPYADQTIEALGRGGVDGLDLVCPGFSADCLETLEEVAMLNRDIFQAAGGGQYRYIPALNDRADHIAALADIVWRNLQGWPGVADTQGQTAQDLAESRKRALAAGAKQ